MTFKRTKRPVEKLDVDLDEVPENIQLELFILAVSKTDDSYVMRNGMIDKTEIGTQQNKILHNFRFYVKTSMEREEI